MKLVAEKKWEEKEERVENKADEIETVAKKEEKQSER